MKECTVLNRPGVAGAVLQAALSLSKYRKFHMSPMPTATITNPPAAYSPTMHSRLIHKDRTEPKKNAKKQPNTPKIKTVY